MFSLTDSLIPAPGLGVIRVAGADAAAFLHAQLTQDLRDVDAGTARPAAWLDPQGRVLVCCDVVGTEAGIDLVLPAELVDATIKRLRLYVLRARVQIERLDDCLVAALPGDGTDVLTAQGIDLGADAGARATAAGTEWYRVGPELAYAYPSPAGGDGSADGNATELAEIRLGRPQIVAATAGRFTAHMLNLDMLGAIAFDKGCYPGQEIVARTQHLGAAKRRMFGFTTNVDDVPAPGDPITDAAGDDVGTVIRAARAAESIELLGVVRRDAIAAELSLRVRGTGLLRKPVPGEPQD